MLLKRLNVQYKFNLSLCNWWNELDEILPSQIKTNKNNISVSLRILERLIVYDMKTVLIFGV
nr:hypothetical protein [Mycoplasmopsis bovis]